MIRAKKLKEIPDDPKYFKFGQLFADHMLSIDWTKQGGWEKPKIIPYGPIKIETSATVLHYGISAHEAITVCENNKTHKLQAFRVEDHLNQFYLSCDHLDMPTFDTKELADCLKHLSVIEKRWLLESKEPDHLFIRVL